MPDGAMTLERRKIKGVDIKEVINTITAKINELKVGQDRKVDEILFVIRDRLGEPLWRIVIAPSDDSSAQSKFQIVLINASTEFENIRYILLQDNIADFINAIISNHNQITIVSA